MDEFRISLAGDLGSGKSTVGAILKERFNAEIVSIGKIQRKMAAEMGMDTCEFNRRIRKDGGQLHFRFAYGMALYTQRVQRLP